jgi:hypothetical protein
VYRKKNRWYVRYYDYVPQEDGSINRSQVARSIAPVCDLYRSKKTVMPLVEKFLKTVNSNSRSPESATTLEHFVEQIYLPYVEEHKRPSTVPTYRAIWRHHLKPRCGNRSVRDFRTVDGETLLAQIARQTSLAKRSVLSNCA